MRKLNVSLFCLVVLTNLGCVDRSFSYVATESTELFQLPARMAPEVKRLRIVEADDYRRFSQYNFDLLVPKGQAGYTGRFLKVLMPMNVPSKRVPCLFYNPAGATAFTGKSAATTDLKPMLPYVDAGFAVVIYGTDGGTIDLGRPTSVKVIAKQAHQYALAHAGLINGRNAIDFALQEFPSIDPDRLYTIGHSSGGKQALLLAASDARIAGCIAFAPSCNFSDTESDMISTLQHHQPSLPASWLRQSNPMAFADRLTVPTLLVYADNDQVVPADDVLRFGMAVGENADVRLVSAPDHFQLPEAGAATARRWLSSQAYQGVPENAPQVTNVKNSNVALDVNNLHRSKESRRTKTTSIDASETKSQKPTLSKDVQLNPYAR